MSSVQTVCISSCIKMEKFFVEKSALIFDKSFAQNENNGPQHGIINKKCIDFHIRPINFKHMLMIIDETVKFIIDISIW